VKLRERLRNRTSEIIVSYLIVNFHRCHILMDSCYLSTIFCPSSVKKKISDFWELNPGPKSPLVTPPPHHHICQEPYILYSILPAGALCELPPRFRVSYTPSAVPDHHVITTLQDCIGLPVIIRGLGLVDVPSDAILTMEGFRLAL